MGLKSQIQDDIKQAMRARERDRLNALRLVTAAIKQKEVDERMPTLGVPPGMFDEMFANITAAANVRLVLDGVEEFEERHAALEALELLETPELAGVLDRLDRPSGDAPGDAAGTG